MPSKSPRFDRFPPSTPTELEKAGWDKPDIVLISGDAFVDHPSFGPAVITRVLEAAGFKVAVLPQPDWRTVEPFRALGEPRLFFAVTGGNVDSMVANYTPFRNKRKKDAYSPGGRPGMRPNRAPIVYAHRAREAFPHVPIVLGGVEASMRRLSHYDFWEDKLRRSILLDAKADLIIYGMAEEATAEAAKRMAAGKGIVGMKDLRGTVFVTEESALDPDAILLPSYEEVEQDKKAFTASFRQRHEALDPFAAIFLAEPYAGRRVVQTPPPLPLEPDALDNLFALPFTGEPHPRYGKEEIPALRTVESSLSTHRGCFGGCTFCGIGFHQGRIIQSRSPESILEEAKRLAGRKSFHGTINDVGGPTANMYAFVCRAAQEGEACRRPRCLLPKPCRKLEDGHRQSVELLEALRELPKVNHVFVQSGIRHDLALRGEGPCYLEALVKHHISGTLKVAPEHSDDKVLKAMGKPSFDLYEKFRKEFDRLNREEGKKQFLVSYFISAHPGCGLKEMKALKRDLDRLGLKPEQIQDYTPLPGTTASVMFYTGLDPFTDKPIHVAGTDRERRDQRRIIQPKGKSSKNWE
ncbi:MAG: YgiQ family radical SAM protein [Planctomycetota bacterium]